MKLIKVIGENVRQFKKLGPIYFPQEGVIGILGLNGAGKTTLMMIIELALYGSINGIVAKQIKHQGCSTSEKWWVELMFEKNGNYYRVYRHENTTKAVLQINGATAQMGQQNVTDYLIKHVLFMDQLSFSTCFYARQDDFDALIRLTDTKRKREVAKLLRIDSIDKAAEKVRKDRNAYLEQIKETKKHMADPQQLASELLGIKEEIKNHNKILDEYEREIKKLETERNELLAQKQAGDSLYEQYQQYLSDYRQIESNIQTLRENSLAKAQERLAFLKKDKNEFLKLLPSRETYQSLLEEKTMLQQSEHDFKRKNSLLKDIESVQMEVRTYEDQITTLVTSLKEIDSVRKQLLLKIEDMEKSEMELTTLLEQHKQLQFELNQKKSEHQKLISAKHKFEELGVDSPCPTCERPLAEHYDEKMNQLDVELNELLSHVSRLKTNMADVESKGRTKRKEFDTHKSDVRMLQQKEQELKRYEDRKNILSSELEKRKKRMLLLEKELEPIQHVEFDEKAFTELTKQLQLAKENNDRTFKLESAIEQIPQLEKDIKQYQSTIDMQAKSMELIKEQVKNLNFDVKAYRELTNVIEEKQRFINEKTNQRQGVFTEIRVLETKLENTVKKQQDFEEKAKSIADKEEEIITLGKLDEVLKNYKDDKLSKLAPALSDLMSELMDTITNGKYDRVELDENYNVNIYRQGVKNPLNFFSGGEQKLAALVQRLAISRLIIAQTGQTGFDLIALDEVLGAMDEGRQNAIVLTLRNLNHMFKQILMITHSDHVKDMLDYSMEIFQDDKMCSHIRWLDEWDEASVEQLAEEITKMSA